MLIAHNVGSDRGRTLGAEGGNSCAEVLGYPSVSEAVAWLTRAFGFTVRWQIEDHRAQLGVGRTAAVAITTGAVPETSDHVMIRVDDVDAHRARAMEGGAVVSEATDYMYGERQYAAT
jgi:hypothetical protein